jgi:hypothetical protein
MQDAPPPRFGPSGDRGEAVRGAEGEATTVSEATPTFPRRAPSDRPSNAWGGLVRGVERSLRATTGQATPRQRMDLRRDVGARRLQGSPLQGGRLSQAASRRLGRQIQSQLKADCLQRVEDVSGKIESHLAAGELSEAWGLAKGWYRLASEHASKPCRQTM